MKLTQTGRVDGKGDMDALRVPGEVSLGDQIGPFCLMTTAQKMRRGLGSSWAVAGPNITEGVSLPRIQEGGEDATIPYVLG